MKQCKKTKSDAGDHRDSWAFYQLVFHSILSDARGCSCAIGSLYQQVRSS